MTKDCNKKKGDDYESFVSKIYAAILKAEVAAGKISSIQLEKKKTVACKTGSTAEFDIYWEFAIGEVVFRTAIECKNYNSAISVDRMRDFVYKLRDAGNVQGIFVAKKGFQKGAIEVAKHEGVKLINLRELGDEDWEGYIKTVEIRTHILQPARITKISPRLNQEWAANNNIKSGDPADLTDYYTNIIIEDNTGYKKSFEDIANQEFSKTHGGPSIWNRLLPGGSIKSSHSIFMIEELTLEYFQPQPTVITNVIDLSMFTLAVLEYVGEAEGKYVITADGHKKPY